jgi:hypothetical protein
MNHVHSSPIMLKNTKMFFNWQYTLKGALLIKKLWPIVVGMEIRLSQALLKDPPFVPLTRVMASIPAGATAAEAAAALHQHEQEYLQIVEKAQAAVEQAALMRAAEHINKYVDLQIDYDKCMGVVLGMIYLSIDPSLKPLIANLESPAEAYKAICACYETNETSQLIRYHSELFALKMDTNTDLHVHFDRIDTLVRRITLVDATPSEAMIAMITISSLPPRFDAIKPVVRMWDTINNSRLRTVLLQHDLSNRDATPLKETLLLSRTQDAHRPKETRDHDSRSSRGDHGNNNGDRKKIHCNHCQFPGHIWKDCCKCL